MAPPAAVAALLFLAAAGGVVALDLDASLLMSEMNESTVHHLEDVTLEVFQWKAENAANFCTPSATIYSGHWDDFPTDTEFTHPAFKVILGRCPPPGIQEGISVYISAHNWYNMTAQSGECGEVPGVIAVKVTYTCPDDWTPPVCPAMMAANFPSMGAIYLYDACWDAYPYNRMIVAISNSQDGSWRYEMYWYNFCHSAGANTSLTFYKYPAGLYHPCWTDSDCPTTCVARCNAMGFCEPDDMVDHGCFDIFSENIHPYDVQASCGSNGSQWYFSGVDPVVDDGVDPVVEENPCPEYIDVMSNAGCMVFWGGHKWCNGAMLRNVSYTCGHDCRVVPEIYADDDFMSCSSYCGRFGLDCEMAQRAVDCGNTVASASCDDYFGKDRPNACFCGGMWNGMNGWPNAVERALGGPCLRLYDAYVSCIETRSGTPENFMMPADWKFREYMAAANRPRCVNLPIELSERIRAIPCGPEPSS